MSYRSLYFIVCPLKSLVRCHHLAGEEIRHSLLSSTRNMLANSPNPPSIERAHCSLLTTYFYSSKWHLYWLVGALDKSIQQEEKLWRKRSDLAEYQSLALHLNHSTLFFFEWMYLHLLISFSEFLEYFFSLFKEVRGNIIDSPVPAPHCRLCPTNANTYRKPHFFEHFRISKEELLCINQSASESISSQSNK